ncbi:MAG: hypothetical protein ACLUDU_12140 [Butyricimonas faecihominis]
MFSFIGMKKQEVAVNDRQGYVILEEDQTEMEEVVVAYFSVKGISRGLLKRIKRKS